MECMLNGSQPICKLQYNRYTYILAYTPWTSQLWTERLSPLPGRPSPQLQGLFPSWLDSSASRLTELTWYIHLFILYAYNCTLMHHYHFFIHYNVNDKATYSKSKLPWVRRLQVISLYYYKLFRQLARLLL